MLSAHQRQQQLGLTDEDVYRAIEEINNTAHNQVDRDDVARYLQVTRVNLGDCTSERPVSTGELGEYLGRAGTFHPTGAGGLNPALAKSKRDAPRLSEKFYVANLGKDVSSFIGIAAGSEPWQVISHLATARQANLKWCEQLKAALRLRRPADAGDATWAGRYHGLCKWLHECDPRDVRLKGLGLLYTQALSTASETHKVADAMGRYDADVVWYSCLQYTSTSDEGHEFVQVSPKGLALLDMSTSKPLSPVVHKICVDLIPGSPRRPFNKTKYLVNEQKEAFKEMWDGGYPTTAAPSGRVLPFALPDGTYSQETRSAFQQFFLANPMRAYTFLNDCIFLTSQEEMDREYEGKMMDLQESAMPMQVEQECNVPTEGSAAAAVEPLQEAAVPRPAQVSSHLGQLWNNLRDVGYAPASPVDGRRNRRYVTSSCRTSAASPLINPAPAVCATLVRPDGASGSGIKTEDPMTLD